MTVSSVTDKERFFEQIQEDRSASMVTKAFLTACLYSDSPVRQVNEKDGTVQTYLKSDLNDIYCVFWNGLQGRWEVKRLIVDNAFYGIKTVRYAEVFPSYEEALAFAEARVAIANRFIIKDLQALSTAQRKRLIKKALEEGADAEEVEFYSFYDWMKGKQYAVKYKLSGAEHSVSGYDYINLLDRVLKYYSL